jgi:hypothetical protein
MIIVLISRYFVLWTMNTSTFPIHTAALYNNTYCACSITWHTPELSHSLPWELHLMWRQLTPCSRVLENLKGPRLVKKFPAFYGTWRFITEFTKARHLSLSWARLIQYMSPSHPISLRFILILFSNLRLGLASGLFLVWRHGYKYIWTCYGWGVSTLQ